MDFEGVKLGPVDYGVASGVACGGSPGCMVAVEVAQNDVAPNLFDGGQVVS